MSSKQKKTRISDLILRTFVFGFRVLGEIDSILTNPYRYMYSLPYGEEAVVNSVQRMVRTGYLSRDGRGRKAKYRLSEKGKERIRQKISRFLTDDVKWDGLWRLVIYDIGENQRRDRDHLRKFLKSLGFGMLQRSIWISPHSVKDELETFLEESGMREAVLVVETKYVGGWGDKELASKVWGLSDLEDEYQKFLDRCQRLRRADKSLRKHYQWLVVSDNLLPSEIFPTLGKTRKEAIEAYQRLLQRKS